MRYWLGKRKLHSLLSHKWASQFIFWQIVTWILKSFVPPHFYQNSYLCWALNLPICNKKNSTIPVKIFCLKLGVVIYFCELLKTKLKNSQPYHPQSQGKVERSHCTGKKNLEFDMKQDYDNIKPYFYLKSNFFHQFATGKSLRIPNQI